MLPLPLAPLLTPMPGCWARLMSIAGCEAPAPAEAGGVTTEPPPMMPPVAPPITGLPFHMASATVRPNPSRVDFWITRVAAR